jgi:hypothetical protein
MTQEEAQKIRARLAAIVFSLTWHDRDGVRSHGTGFFISAEGTALTAFHNLSPEVLDDPNEVQAGRFGDTDVAFRWVLRGDGDREWQKNHDIAILQTDSVPEGLTPMKYFFLGPRVREGRGSAWAENDVAMLGYPACAGFALDLLTGRVDRIQPLRDHIRRNDGAPTRLPDAIQIGPDHSGELTGLRGMSGSPLYDAKYGGITGLVVGVEKKVSASELWPVAEYWPHGKELLKSLPVTPPSPPIRRWLLFAALLLCGSMLCGLMWWRQTRHTIPRQLSAEVMRLQAGRTEPVNDGTVFRNGEHVRFHFTSPKAGHLYVVDQEIVGGELKEPLIIFPTLRTGAGRNRVEAGTPVDFPGEEDVPPYLEPSSGEKGYEGELLTLLIFPNPLPVALKETPIPLEPALFSLDGLRPRSFIHPLAPSADAVAIRRMRLRVTP